MSVSQVNTTEEAAISFPEPSNFLQRMLDENEDPGKNQFLGDPLF